MMINKKLKTYLILALSLVLLCTLAVGSYAWFQKIVERDGLNFTTGKINVAMEAYTFDTSLRVQDGTTYVVGASEDSPTSDALTVVDGNFYQINPTTPAKYYFIIYQQDDSIDLSFGLSFRLMGMDAIIADDGSAVAGTPSDYLSSLQNAGDFKFVIDDIKSDQLFADQQVSNPTYDQVKDALSAYLSAQTQQTEAKTAEINAQIALLKAEINAEGTTPERIAECETEIVRLEHDLVEMHQPAGGDNLINLSQHRATDSLALDTNRFAVYSLTVYNSAANVEEYIGKSFKIQAQLMVSQRNIEAGGQTYYISTPEQLESLLLGYEPGSTFYLMGNIVYKKDLTFNVPASLNLQSYTLTVQGNLTFSFNAPYDITIDTSGGGQLMVVRNLNVGGNFRINTPASKVSFIGRGNVNYGKGDVYVQGLMSVGANYTQGVVFHNSNIYRSLDGTNSPTANHYQTIRIEDGTLVKVNQHTTVGPLSASSNNVQKMAIYNEGVIASVNFASMNYNGEETNVEPQIFLYNNSEITDSTIYLPGWSKKWYVNAVGDIPAGYGNTRIIQGMSSNELTVSGATSDDGSHFVKGDIEVLAPETLVETIDGDYTQLFVRYYNKLENGVLVQTTLKSILEDWCNQHQDVYGATQSEWNDFITTSLTKLVVQNASGKYLTGTADVNGYDDYSYIRSMKGITHLDLSQALAEVGDVVVPIAYDSNKNVTQTVEGKYAFLPTGALNGFSATTYIRIPSNTQVLFVNSLPALREMHLPESVIAIARKTTNLSGLSLSRWLFINTTSQVIEGLVINENNNSNNVATIISVPDQMQSAYVSKYSTSATDNMRHRIMPEGVLDSTRKYLVREIASGEWELLRASPYNVQNDAVIGGGITLEAGGTAINIVKVGNYAYYEYSNSYRYHYTTSVAVSFAPSVLSVGDYAFYHCSTFKNLDMVNVQSIGAYAFKYATISNILNAQNVTSIGTHAFANVYNLTTIHINSVTTMGSYAFSQCASLTTIDAEGATRFGTAAFYGCNALVDVTCNTVTSIGASCFEYCNKLQTLNFPVATSAPYGVAQNCPQLTTALFPSATNVGGIAFRNCPSLETVDVRSTKQIGASAFSNNSASYNYNSKLRFIYAPNCTTVGKTAFDRIKICILGGVENMDSWPSWHGDNGGIIFFFNHVGDVPDSYKSNSQTNENYRVITSESFAQYTSWAGDAYNASGERTIPDEDWDLANFYVSTDGVTATPLLSITHEIAQNSKYIFFIKGGVCELVTVRTSTINVAQFPSVITVTHDDGSTTSHPLTSIGEFACNKSTYVFKGADDTITTDDTLVIPKTVTNIGMSAFRASTIYDLAFEEGSQLQTIGDYAFASITTMTGELAFPNTMTSIGNYAFYGTAITDVTFASSGQNDFKIGNYAFYTCADLVSDLVIPANVTSIGTYAFASTGLTSVTFAQRTGNLAVGTYAFNACRSLTSATFDENSTGSTTLGTYAFANTDVLAHFQLVQSITSIGSYAFQNSGATTFISAENNNTDCTFAGSALRDSKFVTIKLSPAQTELPANFAYNTVTLKYVEAEGVTSVGREAFANCKVLASVYMPNLLSATVGSFYLQHATGNTLYRMDIGSVTTWRNDNSSFGSLYSVYGGIVIVHGTKSVTTSTSLFAHGTNAFKNGIVLMNSTNRGYYAGTNSLFFYLPEGFSTDDIVESEQTVDGVVGKYLYIDMDNYNIEGNHGLYLVYCTARNLTSAEFLDDVALLESQTGKKVTRIGDACFFGCTFDDAIFTLPENVLQVGRLFYTFKSVTQFNFNSKLETIDASAFNGLTTMSFSPIPASVKKIGASAFYNCYALEGTVDLPNVESISSSAFYNCDGIVTVNLGSNLTNLASSTFYDCDAMTSITAPAVKTIASKCFYSCGLLTLVDMPSFESFTGASDADTFSYCHSLSLIKFGAFYNASGIYNWRGISDNNNGAIILCQPVTQALTGNMTGATVYNQGIPRAYFPHMHRIGCYGSNQNVFPDDDGRESYLPEGITADDLVFYGTRLVNGVNVFEYIYARKTDGSLILVACLKEQVTAEQAELDLLAMEQDALARYGVECHFTEFQGSAYTNTAMSGSLTIHEGVTTIGLRVYYQRSEERPKSFDVVNTNDLTTIPGWTFHQTEITSLILDTACTSITGTSPVSPELISNVTILQNDPDVARVSCSSIFSSSTTKLFVSARVYDNYKSGWAGIPSSRISTFDISVENQGATFYFIVDEQTGNATLTFVTLIDLNVTTLAVPSVVTVTSTVDGVETTTTHPVTAFDENAFLSIKDSGVTTLVIPSELSADGLNFNASKFLQNLTAFQLPTADANGDGNVIYTSTNFSVVDGLLLSKDGSILYLCPMKFVPTDGDGNPTSVYVLPETVRSVTSYAFANCQNFTYTFAPTE